MLTDISILYINKQSNIIWNIKPTMSRFKAKFIDNHPKE